MVFAVVCNGLACSSKSVGTILAEGSDGHPLPDYATFARWLAEDKADENGVAFREIYARAKEAQADFMAEELAELHNKAWIPAFDNGGSPLFDAKGNPLMTVDKASAAIVRLEAENKKWLMGKLKPRKYGDKIAVGGADDLPAIAHTHEMTDEALMAIAAGAKKA